MAEFVLEVYASRTDPDEVATRARRARLAAEELAGDGAPVRFVRSMFVPEDETCFLVFEADTAEEVREAARRAALPSDRVALAIAGRGTEEE